MQLRLFIGLRFQFVLPRPVDPERTGCRETCLASFAGEERSQSAEERDEPARHRDARTHVIRQLIHTNKNSEPFGPLFLFGIATLTDGLLRF